MKAIKIKRREYEPGKFTLDVYVGRRLHVAAVSKARALDVVKALLSGYRHHVDEEMEEQMATAGQ